MDLVPIGDRIKERLAEFGQNAAWLADKAGVERSTISRVLSGDRKRPTADTLDHIAAVFGVTLAELVEGTDAQDRMVDEERLIPKSAFDDVMAHMLRFEREGIELRGQVRERDDACRAAETALATALAQADREKQQLHRTMLSMEQDKTEARRALAQCQEEALRYRAALDRAVYDVSALKIQLSEAMKKIEDTRFTSRAAALLATLGTAVSVATYLKVSDSPAPKKGSKNRNPTSKKKVPPR